MNSNLLVLLGLAGFGLVIIIVLYYYIQYRKVNTAVSFVEYMTGIDVPLLGAPKKHSRTVEIIKREIKDPENQKKAMTLGLAAYKDFKEWRESRKMKAPLTRQELNQMNTRELNRLYRELVNPNLSENTVIPRQRAINELVGRDPAVVRVQRQTRNAEFRPVNERVKLKRLTAVYEPLNAPRRLLRAPKVAWDNLGRGKGSVITAHESDGDIATTMIAQTSFQIKEARAESMSDGTIVVTGKNLGGRKFTLFAQATQTLRAPLSFVLAPKFIKRERNKQGILARHMEIDNGLVSGTYVVDDQTGRILRANIYFIDPDLARLAHRINHQPIPKSKGRPVTHLHKTRTDKEHRSIEHIITLRTESDVLRLEKMDKKDLERIIQRAR